MYVARYGEYNNSKLTYYQFPVFVVVYAVVMHYYYHSHLPVRQCVAIAIH